VTRWIMLMNYGRDYGRNLKAINFNSDH
jgi:hypothetical protein